MKDKNCTKCKFFYTTDNQNAEGQCRKNTPKFDPFSDDHQGLFPSVNNSTWCGEFVRNYNTYNIDPINNNTTIQINTIDEIKKEIEILNYKISDLTRHLNIVESSHNLSLKMREHRDYSNERPINWK